MKTTMGKEKVKVWISETVRTIIATRLFRGLALGALLVVGTGLYVSINPGEAGSPLVSERSEVFPGFLQTEVWLPGDTYPVSAVSSPVECYPELGPCASEFVAVAPTTVDRYDRGLFDEVLPDDLKQNTAGRPLSNRELERMDYEIDSALFDAARDSAAGRPVSSEDLERLAALDEAQETLLDELSRSFVGIASSSSETTQVFEVEELEAPVIGVPAYSNDEINQAFQASAYWVQRDEAEEMLFDELSRSFAGISAAGSPSVSERIQCYPEDVVLGWCYGFADAPDPALATDATISGVQFEEWPEVGFDSYTYHRFMVEQGKVGRVDTSTDMEVFGPGDDLSMLLDQAKVDSPSSIDLNEVWTEIEDTPVFHLLKQLKEGSPSRAVDYSLVDWEEMSLDLAESQAFSSSREENQCYPEMDSQCSPGFNVGALYVAISPEVLRDLARMYAGLDEMVPGGPASSEEMAVAAEIDDVEAMAIYGYPASIFYALNEGKVARPPSINGITCYPEDGC